MINAAIPFLSFTGEASEALDFYAGLFPFSEVAHRSLYGPEEEGEEGKVRLAILKIGTVEIRMIDAPKDDLFRMTAGVSILLHLSRARDVDRLAVPLSQDGLFLMAPDAYPFAERYAWVEDRYGVNWQLMFGSILEPGA